MIPRSQREICSTYKETKGKSSGQQNTLYNKIKTASPKKTIFNPPKILPNFFLDFFHFYIKQLCSADATMYKKILKIKFLPMKT